MRTFVILVVLVLAALAAAGTLIYSGLYNIAATEQHLAPTYWLLEAGMRQSVRRGADSISVPPLDDSALADRGLSLFREHCAPCHGAPGVAPEPYARGLTPLPANLVHTARSWRAAELFWVVKYGIKMTGMPAWEYRLPDDDLWAVVAFLQRLPALSPAQYQELASRSDMNVIQREREQVVVSERGDLQRGKQALQQYACVTCHRIPGVVGAYAPVGPPLNGMGKRGLIAGMLPHTTENMVRWLREPQNLNPQSAMPDLGVTQRDARDIAAYLATLE